MRLQLSGLARLHWRHWGEEWLVFDEGSGQTFVTDALLAAALMALESGPLSASELESRIIGDLQYPPSAPPIATRLAAGLEFLTGLGLIETAA